MEFKEMKDVATNLLIKQKKLSKKDVTRVSVSTRHLKVPLTQDEIVETADKLAQSLGEIKAIETELDSIKSQFKSKLKELEGKADGYTGKVRDKYEIRKIDCIEVMNNTIGNVVEMRMDTKKIINERNLTADERQGRLWEDKSAEKTEETASD